VRDAGKIAAAKASRNHKGPSTSREEGITPSTFVAVNLGGRGDLYFRPTNYAVADVQGSIGPSRLWDIILRVRYRMMSSIWHSPRPNVSYLLSESPLSISGVTTLCRT